MDVSKFKSSFDMIFVSDISNVDSESDGRGERITKSINLLMNKCEDYF